MKIRQRKLSFCAGEFLFMYLRMFRLLATSASKPT